MTSQKKILYLFDVDGTLTKPRQKITEEFRRFILDEVKSKVDVGLVSGSDYMKISEQMGGEDVVSNFNYVFSENGLVHHKNGKKLSSESIVNHLGEQKLQEVINFAMGYMSNIKLPVKRGNFIEFRSSMLNICPVGRSCNQIERDQFSEYDSKHKVRQQFVEALQSKFKDSGLKFALGGQISIDVFPIGWDKTYCLNHIASENFAEIHFFGDKTDPGGNDHEIYNDSRTVGHRVSSPSDTEMQVKKCLNME